MNIKKAAQCLVELVVTSDGNVFYLVRLPNGQPAELFTTPVSLTEFFTALSQDDPVSLRPHGAAD